MTDMLPTNRQMEPDAGLVARIAERGDRAALAELMVRHGKTLYAIAYSVLFDAAAAEDAVRATFREVRRSARVFDAGRRSVQRWIVELVRRMATHRIAPNAVTVGERRPIAWLPVPEPVAYATPPESADAFRPASEA